MATVYRMNMLGAAVESTVGTSVFSGMDDDDTLFHVMNVDVQTEIDYARRTLQGSLSNLTSVHGPRSRVVTFSLFAYGAGSAGLPTWANIFLPACGLKETTASFWYTPSSLQTDHTSLSLAVYKDGKVTKVRGARGNVNINFVHGRPIEFQFEFRGVYDGEEDEANPTGQSWPTIVPPRVGSAAVSLGSFTPVLSQFNINSQNVVELRPTIANDDAWISAIIVDRAFGGSADPEDELVATNDYFAQVKAHTEQALSIAVGTVQYNKITITAPKFQWNTITETNRQGLNALNATFTLNADLANGSDNEIKIFFPQS